MRWGISFKLPATHEFVFWDDNMPLPSQIVRLKRSDGRQTLLVTYQFSISPQNWKEWQRVAAIKVQIQNRIDRVSFVDYEHSDSIKGPIYSVSDLGRDFPAFVKFPKPQFPQEKKDIYQKLCRHAKRLVYEKLLHLEQLIAVSMWFNEFIDLTRQEGPTQTIKRAKSAYKFAIANKDNWPKKLTKNVRKKVLSAAAKKSAEVKRMNPDRKIALDMYRSGSNANQISKFLGVHRKTIGRWVEDLKSRQKISHSGMIHFAGDILFVYFSGQTMNIYNAKTGETDTAQIFVSVLGASGYTFVHAVLSQNTEDFIECHNKAFSFYGGVPNIVVPDNLKAAVISNKKGKVILNESYTDMACHYGVAIVPARPYHPQDKSKVELGVKGCQRWIRAKLRHRQFFDINELNSAIGDLLDGYNAKVIRRLGKSRDELFTELDKPALYPLRANTYLYREHKRCIVNMDYHIELYGNGYSVPYTYLKKQVDVWYSRKGVTISFQGDVIANHPRLNRPHEDSTMIEHMPKEHQYQQEKWSPHRILHWSNRIGPYTTALMETIMQERSHPTRGYKSCVAILSFSKTYGADALERICERSLQMNTHSVSAIKQQLISN